VKNDVRAPEVNDSCLECDKGLSNELSVVSRQVREFRSGDGERRLSDGFYFQRAHLQSISTGRLACCIKTLNYGAWETGVVH
jgi:hypothetical protein